VQAAKSNQPEQLKPFVASLQCAEPIINELPDVVRTPAKTVLDALALVSTPAVARLPATTVQVSPLEAVRVVFSTECKQSGTGSVPCVFSVGQSQRVYIQTAAGGALSSMSVDEFRRLAAVVFATMAASPPVTKAMDLVVQH
jgi:hypothetical protein